MILGERVDAWYCWWFRNPKQPPGKYKTRRKSWDKLPTSTGAEFQPSTVPGTWNIHFKMVGNQLDDEPNIYIGNGCFTISIH